MSYSVGKSYSKGVMEWARVLLCGKPGVREGAAHVRPGSCSRTTFTDSLWGGVRCERENYGMGQRMMEWGRTLWNVGERIMELV